MAVAFGSVFVLLQGLSYAGYIQVNQAKMQKDVEKMLDLNDDGKIDVQDGEMVYKKVMSVLQYNMPAGGGFAAGFVGGLRSG
mmetsp:Transcript_30898/g.71206  ORF Transcript_30898/g.71206 Transcript_30898/m.71206 type:complete len:82 (+) Transcript_30898:514-759(+)